MSFILSLYFTRDGRVTPQHSPGQILHATPLLRSLRVHFPAYVRRLHKCSSLPPTASGAATSVSPRHRSVPHTGGISHNISRTRVPSVEIAIQQVSQRHHHATLCPLAVSPKHRQIQEQLQQKQPPHLHPRIMGSANCKEYKTNSNNGTGGAKPPGTGTTGTYQSTCEANTNMAEYTDPVRVCHVDDIQEHEMKQLDFMENTKILMIKQNGTLNAIGNKCTHYGAMLYTGVLSQGRVRCPWHGACFNIETGDIEDFPGLDSVPCYKVEVEKDGQVMVRAKRKDLDNNKRLKDMVKPSEDNKHCYVIIGGGPSGAVCAETLRQEGFTGRIVMVCREPNYPYDRVKASKAMDTKIETIQFRPASFYEEHGIEMLMGVEATKVNSAAKLVSCNNGKEIKFDKLYIATGCRPAKPPIVGAEMSGVFTIRDITEANTIARFVNSQLNVVCLGSSFIAMEAASFLSVKAKSTTVVGRDNVPLKPAFGQEIGERVLRLFEENGVTMIMNSGIQEILGIENRIGTVVLNDGTKLPCDLLIMGTGSRFYTDFLQDSGIAVNSNGSIDTDMHLRTNIPDIYAGGDIANAPVYSFANQRATIGHFQLAQYHGRIAAINMTGTTKTLRAVPFFFTMLFGKGFRYSGYGPYNDVLIDGDLEGFKFAAYFLDHYNNVVAVASVGRDPIVAQFAELQSQGKRLHRSDIVEAANTTAWASMLKTPACLT